MDLSNFDEVTRAIREENWNMGVNLNNLDASVSDYANKGADSYWADCMREVVGCMLTKFRSLAECRIKTSAQGGTARPKLRLQRYNILCRHTT